MIEKRYCLTPEEWAYAKAELVLAEKLGLIENADIEALEKRCAEKNEENARLEMEKKVFYGPRRYSLPMYLQYELTRFRLDFVQPTENIRKSGISPEITENQKKAESQRQDEYRKKRVFCGKNIKTPVTGRKEVCNEDKRRSAILRPFLPGHISGSAVSR